MPPQVMADLAEYAQQARELAEAIETDAPHKLDPKLLAEVLEIKRLAAATVEKAESSVKIGLVGQFNAGKSLLLGGLAGFANGIPVKPVATTGNVTYLHFLPSDDPDEVHTTRFENYVVEFLDLDGAQACLGEMLAEARRLAKDSGLSEDRIATLAGFKHNEKSTLTGFDAWCRLAWDETKSYPPMRFLLIELTWFIRTYLACGAALCKPLPSSAASYEITPIVAENGLALKVPEKVERLTYENLPEAPPSISESPGNERVTAEFLHSVFPLIARVKVDVVVARGIWDLRPLRGVNEFVLLDFPGLGAAFSRLRDRFLCVRELGDVQTILLLLNSVKPAEGGWDPIYKPLAQKRADLADCVLVGVSLFDCLPLTDGEKQWIKSAADVPEAVAATARRPAAAALSSRQKAAASAFDGFGDDSDEDEAVPAAETFTAAPLAFAGPLTEEMVLSKVETLRSVVSAALIPVPNDCKDRVVFLSPMIYLKHLADEDTRLMVSTPDFLADIAHHGAAAEEMRRVWKAIAAKIRHDNPDVGRNGLTGWLERYAADGGIGALRTLLASHAATHGLNQLAREVEASANDLRDAVNRLSTWLPRSSGPAIPLTDPDRVQSAKATLRKLADHYRTAANEIKNGVVLQVERGGVAIPVTRLIEDEAIHQIYSWPHWENLLQSLREGYIVEGTGDIFIDDPDESVDGGVDWGDDDDAQDSEDEDDLFPTRGDDFFRIFEQTLRRLQNYTREQIEAGIDHWLSAVGKAVASDRRELASLLAAPGLAAEVRRLKLRKSHRMMVKVLNAAADPRMLKPILVPDGAAARHDMARSIDPAWVFPQSRSQGGNDPGRIFGWAKKLLENPNPDARPDPNLSHQAQLIRLRDQFVTIITQEMAQTVSLVLKELDRKMIATLADVGKKLQQAEVHGALVDTLVRGGSPPPPNSSDSTSGAVGDPLSLVRKLLALHWPLAL